ncbi:uncharacterized protein C8R40DRAFT_1175472 [Lentinula edodes]|uniref:uncharacterized protein n=1 Tax=Lentinula edodes TaxID=5353 RepID=UPI001E8CF91D|nr:uncharacterized protein C8R40DRAFT_1175472 [Lentinula edodes]KAH7870676.1 hypothetical protein C8R40DRAFT_1175472 [Lentinula edodes]
MVNNSNSHMVEHCSHGYNSQWMTLVQPETPLSSILDRSVHNNPFTGVDASLKTPHPVVVDNPVEAYSQYKLETRRQGIMNKVNLHGDSVAFKHMVELLEKLEFKDTFDNEAQVFPSPAVKLPWISPHTSKLLNNPQAQT